MLCHVMVGIVCHGGRGSASKFKAVRREQMFPLADIGLGRLMGMVSSLLPSLSFFPPFIFFLSMQC